MIRKILMGLAAVVGFTAAATAAPTAVAVWDGDFNRISKAGTDSVTYTLDLRGNGLTTDNGIQISQDVGAKIAIGDPATFGGQGAILVKYSGLVVPASGQYSIAGVKDTTSASGYYAGAFMKAAGSATLSGYFEGGSKAYDFANNPTPTASGYLLFAYSAASGTSCYVGETLASLAGGCAGGLHWSNMNIAEFFLGGNNSAQASGYRFSAWNGLKIEKVAIFKEFYNGSTVTAFADYKWPSETRKVISVNIANSTDSAIAVQDDDAIETPLGTLTGTAWNNIGTSTEAGERRGSISTVKAWDGTAATTYDDVTVAWTTTSGGFANMLDTAGSKAKILRTCYNRLSGASIDNATLTVTGLANHFAVYDVLVYVSGNDALPNAKATKPINVNGTAYYGDTAAVPYGTSQGSSSSWGALTSTAVEYGKNAIRICGLKGDLTLNIGESFEKWGFASFQIVESDPMGKDATATIPSGADITWANIPWDDGAPGANDTATLTLEGDATITVDAAAACAKLTATGTGTLTLDAGDNLTVGPVLSEIPLVLTTAKNLNVNAGANALTYNYTGASEITANVTYTGNFTKGGSGTMSLSHNVPNGTTLTVSGGTLKLAAGGKGIVGTLVVAEGATFVNTTTADALRYDGDSPRIDVYGTLDLEHTRWTMRNNATYNLYAGSTELGDGTSSGSRAFDFNSNASTVNFKKKGDQGGTVNYNIVTYMRDGSAGLTFNVEEGVVASVGNAIRQSNGARTVTKQGAGTLQLASGGELNFATLAVTAGAFKPTAGTVNSGTAVVFSNAALLDLSGLATTAADIIAGNLTMAETTGIRFPAGFAENDTFTLCGGTLTASEKVANATVYVGDSETPVENATLVYDAENKTVSYTTSAPGSIVITGSAVDLNAIDEAIEQKEGPGYTGDVMLTVDPDATITIDRTFGYSGIYITSAGAAALNYALAEADTYAKIHLGGIAGDLTVTTSLALPVDAGARNLTYNYTGSEPVTNTALTAGGTFTKGGPGTLFVSFGSSRTAPTVVAEGKLGYQAASALGNGVSITVNAFATLDFNGFPKDGAPVITLAGGTLMNGVNAGGFTNYAQIPTIVLTADSFIDTPYEFGLIASGYKATTLTLNDHTLTKRGAGAFNVANATIGAGTIVVEQGAINFHNAGSTFTDGTLELAGGTLSRNAAFSAGAVTVTANSAITGNGNLIAPITISNDATLDCTGVTLPVAGASLAAAQQGTLKITKPAAPTKIATAAVTVGGLALVDENGTALDSCMYDGFFWYGQAGDTYTLTDDDKTAIGELSQGGVFSKQTLYPGLTTVAGTPEGYVGWTEGTVAYVAKKTDSISIKFGPRGANEGKIGTTDASVGGYPVAGKFWNHSKIYNDNNNPTTEIFPLKDGNGETLEGVLCYYYAPNTYVGHGGQTTGNGKLTKTYFDDTDRATPEAWPYSVGTYGEREYFLPATPTKEGVTANLRWEVAITNIPYQVFDLYIYQASDQTAASIKLLPIAVKANDGEWKYFAGDNEGSTVAATYDAIWDGAAYCNQEEMVEGTHYIRYRISKAALGLGDDETISVIYLSHPQRHDSARLGLAGVQIVAVANDGYYTRNPEAPSNDWLAEDTWLNSSGSETTWQNPEGTDVAYATIDADEVTTINIDGAVVASEVKLVNTEAGTFTFTTSNDGTLTAPIDATEFHGKIDIPDEGLSSTITLGENAYIEVEVPDGVEVALEDILPENITVVGTVKIVGEGTVVCDGAFPTAYKTSFQNADTWHGTVWLKNVVVEAGDSMLSKYGNANSKVKATGVIGYMNANGDQGIANLVLEDDGDTLAFEIDDTSQNWTYNYAKFTGDGTFKFATVAGSAAGTAIADVSEFTGALLSKPGLHHDTTRASRDTTARPIYVGTATATAGTASLISVANGARINSGCGWEADSVQFGATLTVKGEVGDVVVGGLTAEPTLDTAVTLLDDEGEEVEGDYCLFYDADAGAVKVAEYVTFALPTAEGIASATVTGGKLDDATVTAYVGYPLAVTYTAATGKLFADGANTKTVAIDEVTTGEAAAETIGTALAADKPVDGKAKIGDTYYLTFAAAVEAANAMASATVEPLVDATVDPEMTVNETVSFKINEGLTLTLQKGGFKATQFPNNLGTIAIVGGTVDAPIALTGNGDFGVMTLAANTYVKNTVDGNRTHNVTGAGASSVYALGKADGGVGFTTAAITNLTLVSDCAAGERVWIERMTMDNVGLVANTMFHLNGMSPTVVSLAGAGSVTRAGSSETLTIACEAACEYSGTSTVPFIVGGTEKLTLSGAYTGALTVNDGATVELGATAVPAGLASLGDAAVLAKDGDALTLTGAITGALTFDESVSNVTFGANRSFGTSLDFEADNVNVVYVENISDDGVMPTLPLAGGSTAPAARMFGVDGVEKEVSEGKFEPSVSGGVCLLDYTFTNTVQTTGGKDIAPAGTSQLTGNLTGDGNTSYTNYNEDTGWYEALHTKVRPYRNYQLATPFTVAVAGCFPSSAKTVLVSFGSSANNLFLASGATDDLVELVRVKTGGGNKFTQDDCTVLTTMKVPNAATTQHTVVFETTDLKTFNIYLDGVKWSTYVYETAQTIGSGIQVGGWYGGSASDDCYHQANATTAPDSYVSAIRLYGAALGPNAIAALAEEFPYISPNGSYSRTLAAEPTAWWQAGQAWKNDETEEMVDKPAAGATVKITGTAETTVAVNLQEDTTYEAITFNGAADKALTFTTNTLTGYPGKIRASGQVSVFSPVSLDWAAIDIAGVPLTIGANGMLVIDACAIDYASYYENDYIPLTGMTSYDYYPSRLQFAKLPTVPGRTLSINYDAGAQTFGVNVVVKGELTGTVAAGSTFGSIVWKMGDDVVTPDWTKVKAAKLVPEAGATLAFDDTDLAGVTFTVEGENSITFTSEAPVAADIVLQNGAKVSALDGTFAVAGVALGGTVAADGTLSLKAGTLKSAGSAIDAIAFAAGTAIELYGENTITAATAAGNVDWLVKGGTTTLGFDMSGNNAIITGANIVIDEGATLVAQTIHASWNYRGLTIDGTLKATKFSRPYNASIVFYSETGVLDVGTLGYGNHSTQTFALDEERIGAGGIVCDQAAGAHLAFSNTTVKATAAWATTCPFALSGDTTFDTAGYDVTLSGEVTGKGMLTKKGAGTLKVANVAAETPVTIEAGTVDLGGVRNLTIGGAGTVDVQLTDAEAKGEAAVQVFTPAAGANIALGTVKDAAGNDITSKCSLEGGAITVDHEAKIGTTYYLTLAEALGAADGNTVTLLKDAAVDALTFNKSFTFDVDGKTATFNGAVTVAAGAVKLVNSQWTPQEEFQTAGGIVVNAPISVADDATLDLSEMPFGKTMYGGIDANPLAGAYLDLASGSTAKFYYWGKPSKPEVDTPNWMYGNLPIFFKDGAIPDGATVVINGTEWTGDAEKGRFVIDGECALATVQGEHQIGEPVPTTFTFAESFATVSNALALTVADGTVTMVADSTEGGASVGKSCTIELDGQQFTANGPIAVAAGATVTLKNNTFDPLNPLAGGQGGFAPNGVITVADGAAIDLSALPFGTTYGGIEGTGSLTLADGATAKFYKWNVPMVDSANWMFFNYPAFFTGSQIPVGGIVWIGETKWTGTADHFALDNEVATATVKANHNIGGDTSEFYHIESFADLATAVAKNVEGDVKLYDAAELADVAKAVTIDLNGSDLSLTGDTLANDLTVKGAAGKLIASGTKAVNADLDLGALDYATQLAGNTGAFAIAAGKTVTLPVAQTAWQLPAAMFAGTADGAKLVTQASSYTYGNGVWAEGEEIAVAKIGNVGYATLDAALDAATADDTVTLLANVTTDAAAAFVINKNITVDFATYTITKTVPNDWVFQIANGADVTFAGTTGGIVHKPAKDNQVNPASIIQVLGKLTVNGGAYESDYTVFKVDEGNGAKGELVVNGGTFTITEEPLWAGKLTFTVMNWSKATLNGGTFNGTVGTMSDDRNTDSKAGETIVGTIAGTPNYTFYMYGSTYENVPKIKGVAKKDVTLVKASSITDDLELVEKDGWITVQKKSAIEPVVPGEPINVDTPEKAVDLANDINTNVVLKAAMLKAPEDCISGETLAAYQLCFTAVADGTAVKFEVNALGTNAVEVATVDAETNVLAVALSADSKLTIAEPLPGFYYSLKQGDDLTKLAYKAAGDQNKLAGKDTIEFTLEKPEGKGFYKTVISATPFEVE